MKALGINVLTGFLFSLFLDERFLQILAVGIPALISLVVSILSGYKKVRRILVDDVTEAVMLKVREELENDREKTLDQIGDELWSRIEVLSKTKHQIENEKPFDVKELAAK